MRKPKKPWEPYPDECCGRGCVPCVYDIYDDNLSKYEYNLKTFKTRCKEACAELQIEYEFND